MAATPPGLGLPTALGLVQTAVATSAAPSTSARPGPLAGGAGMMAEGSIARGRNGPVPRRPPSNGWKGLVLYRLGVHR